MFSFGLHYAFECVVYESDFWRRANPSGDSYQKLDTELREELRDLEAQIFSETDHTPLLALPEQKNRDDHDQEEKKPNLTSRIRSLKFKLNSCVCFSSKEYIPPITRHAQKIVGEAFLALLILNSFSEHQSGSSFFLIFGDGLLRKSISNFKEWKRLLLKQRSKELIDESRKIAKEKKALLTFNKGLKKRMTSLFEAHEE